MKTTWAGLFALSLLCLGPAEARASGLELRIGGFQPQANANLFEDTAVLFGTRDRDWRGVSGGVEFALGLGDRAELGLHLDAYSRTLDTVYVEYAREDGGDIFQTLRLHVVPLGFSLRLLPLGDRAAVSPYLAAGADVFFYKYEEFGEFIDFFADNEIVEDSFVSDGAAGGFHVAAGLRVPVSHDFAVTGEVRHQWAKADMGDDFRQNRIDLGGTSVTLGFHVRF